MNFEWIDKIINESKFEAPYVIEKDSDYERELKKLTYDYIEFTKHINLDTKSYQEIEDFGMLVSNVLNSWYSGEPWLAQHLVDECVNEMLRDGICICKLNKCPAIQRYKCEAQINEVRFFRARLVNEYGYYYAKNMFHIPLEERSKASAERYSIPGLPCLYLGNTSYVCWAELGRPSTDKIAIAPVVVDDGVEIFNLSVSVGDMRALKEDVFENELEREKEFVKKSKLLLLMMAASFVVTEENRSFKSEYIIPQLIMLSVRRHNLAGVTYYSTKTKGGLFNSIGVNVALFPNYNQRLDGLYEERLDDKVYIGNARNFEMYKHLIEKDVLSASNMRRSNETPGHILMYDGGFATHYNNTDFSGFDDFLFYKWPNRIRQTFLACSKN